MTDSTALQPTGDGVPDTLPEIAAPSGPIQLRSLDDVMQLGRVLAASGFYQDVRDAAQAVVKILAGSELGIPPIAAMRGVYVIDGNTTLNSSLIASLIQEHPRYDYRVVHATPAGAEIAFFEDGTEVGRASFDREDAKRAGLTRKRNWQQYPEDMMFARAMTRGARRYCPSIFNGPIYTPEELGGGGITVESAPDPAEPEATPEAASEQTPSRPSEAAREVIASMRKGLLESSPADYDDHLARCEEIIDGWPSEVAQQAAYAMIEQVEAEREQRLAEPEPDEDLSGGDADAAPFLKGESRTLPANQ